MPCHANVQEVMNKMSKGRGGPSVASLNNVLMQMRKCANHPDLITGPFDGACVWCGAVRGAWFGVVRGEQENHPPATHTFPASPPRPQAASASRRRRSWCGTAARWRCWSAC